MAFIYYEELIICDLCKKKFSGIGSFDKDFNLFCMNCYKNKN